MLFDLVKCLLVKALKVALNLIFDRCQHGNRHAIYLATPKASIIHSLIIIMQVGN